MSVDLKEYQNRLECLKHNKENVSLEELKTKYGKAYAQLKEFIREMTIQILQDVVFEDLLIERAHAQEVYQSVNREIEKSGILQEVSVAVFKEQCMEHVLECAERLKKIVHQAVDEVELKRREYETI